jgi:hypothetical protein
MKIDPLITKFREYILTLAHGPEEDREAAAYASPAVHFALYTRILDQDNKVIDPMPNILQLRMCEAYETLKAMGIRVRIIITKPRRAGCSSFVEHIGYHEAMKRPINGMTIADDKEGSKAAMNKLGSFETMDSFPWNVSKTNNPAHSITWNNGSTWIVDTAENADAGAGDTLHFFHGTEVSKWPKTTVKNDAKVMSCVSPALSGMDTVMFCESTPEGAVGWQYETWAGNEGQEGAIWLHELLERWEKGIRPEEVWVKVFAAWFEFTENRRQNPVSPEEIRHFQETLTDHEREEIELYDLDWEQIGWRRDTIRTKCGGDPKVFSYYYPSDDRTCWLGSGSPAFDMEKIVAMEAQVSANPPQNGFLVLQDTGRVSYHPQHDGSGDIQIWEMPIPGCKYAVILDPAGDKRQTIGKDNDRHALAVWRDGYFDEVGQRYRKPRKVARVKPPYQANSDEVAKKVIMLSKLYGTCIYGQEVNIGLEILREVELAGIPLFQREPLSHRTGKVEKQYGFKMTDSRQRSALIQGLATAIRLEEIEVHCPHTLREYKAFIRNGAKMEAAPGKHDDDVLADAIALAVLPSATTYRTQRVRQEDPPDRKRWKVVKPGHRGGYQ